MKQLLHKIARYFLPVLFISYIGCISLFTHSHVVNGVTIVHSHPYKPGTEHGHTTAEFQLIHMLSSIETENPSMWTNAGEEKAFRSIGESLRKLKTDYIDLLLIHQPFGDYYGTYRAMERAYRDGMVRAIGLSNFYDARFVDLVENVEVKPSVFQLETHVFSQQKRMRELIDDYGMHLMAWGPLAQGSDRLFTDETLKTIGTKYGKTNAQVALKFLTSEGIVAIPKSIHKDRMASNFNIADFELTEEDKETIRRMDTGKLKVDFNDPDMARYLLEYDKKFNPNS